MVKAWSSTPELPLKLLDLSTREVSGIPSVEVKFVDIGITPVAKAAHWLVTDAQARQRGDQTGLDTLVVHAVNDEC